MVLRDIGTRCQPSWLYQVGLSLVLYLLLSEERGVLGVGSVPVTILLSRYGKFMPMSHVKFKK